MGALEKSRGLLLAVLMALAQDPMKVFVITCLLQGLVWPKCEQHSLWAMWIHHYSIRNNHTFHIEELLDVKRWRPTIGARKQPRSRCICRVTRRLNTGLLLRISFLDRLLEIVPQLKLSFSNLESPTFLKPGTSMTTVCNQNQCKERRWGQVPDLILGFEISF
ncbi:hypothetical protein OIU78_008730 [Salix suchowensis]|nr:hypothetical protein OIU78_008730 [Salix suchowensis]